MKTGKQSNSHSVYGFYRVGLVATFLGLLVILIMNLATPFEFVANQIQSLNQHETYHWSQIIAVRFGILCLMALVSTLPFFTLMRFALAPVHQYLSLLSLGEFIQPSLEEKARQRVINLPFIMVPVNIGLWILLPMLINTTLFNLGIIDSGTAITFAVRSTMVGLISSAIVFFGLEAQARKTLIPLLFPQGGLSRIDNTIKVSISRRIRAFYRMGSLIPMAHIVLTLFMLFLQMDAKSPAVRDYAWSVFLFSLVVFCLFFFGSGILNKMISTSIADPINAMLCTMKEVRKGNYNTRVQVVSNDEVGILGDAFNRMIQGLEDRERMRDAFGRYVDPEIRDEILSGHIPLDGEYKEVTVLFADLRDFTPLTATHDPKEVVGMLNAYFKEMGAAIKQNSGLILQFLGDEIYAVFGAPVASANHPADAVQAALEMEKRLMALNKTLANQDLPLLSHGIGIHTGQVLAANIGSPDRLSYLLVGDTVNLASRLQTLTRELEARIIVSAQTVACLPEDFSVKGLEAFPEPVPVKGLSKPAEIYQIKTK